MKGEEAIFDPSKWHGKAISVVNSSPAAQIRDPFPPAIRMIEQGIIDLKPLVTHTVTLDECKMWFFLGLSRLRLADIKSIVHSADPKFMEGVVSGQVPSYIKGVVVYDNETGQPAAKL